MGDLRLSELLGKRILMTRASARSIQHFVMEALEEGHGEIALDLSGVDGLTPSFMDELLLIIEENREPVYDAHPALTVRNPPTELTAKFEAVGRGHGLVVESNEGGWTFEHEERMQD